MQVEAKALSIRTVKLIPTVAHGLKTLGESSRIAVVAAWRHSAATRRRIPGCISPLDPAVVGHGGLILGHPPDTFQSWRRCPFRRYGGSALRAVRQTSAAVTIRSPYARTTASPGTGAGLAWGAGTGEVSGPRGRGRVPGGRRGPAAAKAQRVAAARAPSSRKSGGCGRRAPGRSAN